MAAVARPATGSSSWDGVKIALIVFVVLTLASLTFMIVLYTHQSDLQTAVADADRKVTQANTAANKSRQDMQDIGQLVLGKLVDEPEQLKQAITTAIQTIAK